MSVVIGFRCGPGRNWLNLWKPTIDALSPLIGEGNRRWNPHDGAIVDLALHLQVDPACGGTSTSSSGSHRPTCSPMPRESEDAPLAEPPRSHGSDDRCSARRARPRPHRRRHSQIRLSAPAPHPSEPHGDEPPRSRLVEREISAHRRHKHLIGHNITIVCAGHSGGAEGTRTPDPLTARHSRSTAQPVARAALCAGRASSDVRRCLLVYGVVVTQVVTHPRAAVPGPADQVVPRGDEQDMADTAAEGVSLPR